MTDTLETGAVDTIMLLRESIADLERQLSKEDAGWQRLTHQLAADGFSPQFRREQSDKALVAMTIDPLIKRGVELRIAYVWGDGVEITVRDRVDDGSQDVNAIVQAFLNDPQNLRTFTDTEARAAMELALARDGEFWFCLVTSPVTGRVVVRSLPAAEMADIVTDPEDKASERLYLREFIPAGSSEIRRVWHPALGYSPQIKDDLGPKDIPIRWDQPVRFVRVNPVAGRGVGDVFSAIPWSQAYTHFLESWAGLMRSLSRFAWQVKTRGDKASKVAQQITQLAQTTSTHPGGFGLGAAMDPNSSLEAIGKSGASFDADSGRPLASVVAAALGIPVTTLLGDPGMTGARATAENVSAESRVVFRMRREVWSSAFRDICWHVIDSAVLAGRLRGTVVRDGDRQLIQLPEGDSRTIIVEWPEPDSVAVLDRVRAISLAAQTQTVPHLTIARALMAALDIPDIDDILAQVTDAEGNFIPLDVGDLEASIREHLEARSLT